MEDCKLVFLKVRDGIKKIDGICCDLLISQTIQLPAVAFLHQFDLSQKKFYILLQYSLLPKYRKLLQKLGIDCEEVPPQYDDMVSLLDDFALEGNTDFITGRIAHIGKTVNLWRDEVFIKTLVQ